MKPKPKMTDAQFSVLEDIARFGDPWRRVSGSAAHGGMHRTMVVIQRNEWAAFLDGSWCITDAGIRSMGLCTHCNGKRAWPGTGLPCKHCKATGWAAGRAPADSLPRT